MSAGKPKLLFYCQHSLGLGHLSRSFALCEALSESFDVVLICGGKLPRGKKPPGGVHIITLPPLGASLDGRLISHDGRRSVERTRELRRKTILETFRALRPEMILVEFFPFGKKRFSSELLPLLDQVRSLGAARPVVVSSIRDILVGRGNEQKEFDDRASQLANGYFDTVLVHADPRFARLEESFRPSVPLRVPVHYTGFVVSNGKSHTPTDSCRDLVVSAGGGIAGNPLLGAAIDAQRLLGNVRMKVIAGPFFPDDDWSTLQRQAAEQPGVALRRSVPDLGAELNAARASVSQCGYNTALDILQASVPALVVPFVANGEDEQTKRARRLEALGAVRVLDATDLDPARLAEEIRVLPRFRPRPLPLDMEGGRKTVHILSRLHAARFGQKAS